MAVWLYGQKSVMPATDGIGDGDGWKASCCGDVFVPDELVPFDLQQLPLTQMTKNDSAISRMSGCAVINAGRHTNFMLGARIMTMGQSPTSCSSIDILMYKFYFLNLVL